MRGVVAVCVCLVGACVKPGAFVCERDDQCSSNGIPGHCEVERYCSFPDSRCASGQRFGAQSGDFSNICVGDQQGGSDGGTGSDGPPMGDVPASGRVTQGLVALFTFDEGSGTSAHDTSGLVPALDLNIGTNATWVAGGLQFAAGASGAESAAAARIVTACMASNEMTIEAWIQSASTSMVGAARIIGVSSTNNSSSSSLGQEMTGYYGQVRTSTSSNKLASANGTTTTSTVHLVHTRATSGARTIYIDGTSAGTSSTGGDFSTWDGTMPITAGNATDGGVLWQGNLLLAAIYCKALSQSDVTQNHTAGP